MGFEYIFLLCTLPIGIYLYIIDTISAIQYLTQEKRFYPLAIRIRFFFYKMVYREERFNIYKEDFDNNRKWRYWSYIHIIGGILGVLIFLLLLAHAVIVVFFPGLTVS